MKINFMKNIFKFEKICWKFGNKWVVLNNKSIAHTQRNLDNLFDAIWFWTALGNL